jgi:hypothetical protein
MNHPGRGGGLIAVNYVTRYKTFGGFTSANYTDNFFDFKNVPEPPDAFSPLGKDIYVYIFPQRGKGIGYCTRRLQVPI